MFPKVEHVQNRKPSSDHLPSTVLLPYFFYLISSCMTTTFLFLWGTLLRHVLTHEWSQDSGLSRCVYVSLLHVVPGPVSESLMCLLHVYRCNNKDCGLSVSCAEKHSPIYAGGPMATDEHPKPCRHARFPKLLIVSFLKGK